MQVVRGRAAGRERGREEASVCVLSSVDLPCLGTDQWCVANWRALFAGLLVCVVALSYALLSRMSCCCRVLSPKLTPFVLSFEE